jgi:GT2 family glycosyltransferase
MFMQSEHDDGSGKAADFIGRTMARFHMSNQWCYQALHDTGHCYGLSSTELARLYREACLIINLHGGTQPLPEHHATGRLVYLETDPVQLQVELHNSLQATLDFLEPHRAFFTFGENIGQPDCLVPAPTQFVFHPTRQPVVISFWDRFGQDQASTYSTIGNWRQQWRDVELNGETYGWSKHSEFMKFIDVPRHVWQPLELALASYEEADQRQLEEHGWSVRHAMDFSLDLDAYRSYIGGSRGEFTVAKEQNVRLRSGWFSDRSATYLAAGRPVVTQDTGFGSRLPTGEGLFAFSDLDDVVVALDTIDLDYERHRRGAREIAHGYFNSDLVLGDILETVGLPRRADRTSRVASETLPDWLVVVPASKNPTTLDAQTQRWVLQQPLPTIEHVGPRPVLGPRSGASVVIVTYNGLLFTRLCIESLLMNTDYPSYEVIVVDNGSTDGTVRYLEQLAREIPHLRVIRNRENVGFPAATNQGIREAQGEILVLLNNDTIPTPGWLSGLATHLVDQSVGIVGAVTNAAPNEARVPTSYRTYGELLGFAAEFAESHKTEARDVRMVTMFCCALRRSVYDELGPLDERFGLGMFEDDDYSARAWAAGYRVLVGDDVFVHHFGEATFGALVPTGEFARVFEENRQRYEAKWEQMWRPHEARESSEYIDLIAHVRDAVRTVTPEDATVLVVSKGDADFITLEGRDARHFPMTPEGEYAGWYPGNSEEAIEHLESLRTSGADYLVFPASSLWWLDHYAGLRRHLDHHYETSLDDGWCRIVRLQPHAAVGEPA